MWHCLEDLGRLVRLLRLQQPTKSLRLMQRTDEVEVQGFSSLYLRCFIGNYRKGLPLPLKKNRKKEGAFTSHASLKSWQSRILKVLKPQISCLLGETTHVSPEAAASALQDEVLHVPSRAVGLLTGSCLKRL